ncbi:M24 family metallopeptidase [Planococcus salinus]|uniref:M24 family metallopeptidase n=1 Tax=Planococcus salinus TaxID=1848460 RepID=UPI0013148E1B|nr:Xaa-Pro peptidase family protein [Planococcus salinus]
MITKRIQNLRAELFTEGNEAALITSPENRFYFSGFKGSSGVLLITKEDAYLLTDFRYIDQAKEEAPFFTVVNHQRKAFPTVTETIEKHGVKKLGVEFGKMPIQEYKELESLNPKLQIFDSEEAIYKLRMIKDQGEIESFRKGIAMCDQAFKHSLSFIRPGMSEKELGLELEFFMRKAGADGIKENHVIASGERSSLPHGQATERIIQVGDFVKMDIGAKVNGYYTDFTRTVVVGEPTDKHVEIYNIVKKAQEVALNAIGPGKVCSELDGLARGVIAEAGYGENFGHSLGHSIGLAVHESPAMRATDDTILQPGMVITVEPGIYIPGFGGVRIEDFIVITEDGYENLTTATKELQVIPV